MPRLEPSQSRPELSSRISEMVLSGNPSRAVNVLIWPVFETAQTTTRRADPERAARIQVKCADRVAHQAIASFEMSAPAVFKME